MGERLDLGEDLAAVVVALSELSERARQAGDRATALVAQDAAEGLYPLLDRLAYLDRARAHAGD